MKLYRNDDGSFAVYTATGCYPVFHVCDDGGDLCADCANEHGHVGAPSDGFRIVASEVNWEDPNLYCDHCSARIESAYAEDE